MMFVSNGHEGGVGCAVPSAVEVEVVAEVVVEHEGGVGCAVPSAV